MSYMISNIAGIFSSFPSADTLPARIVCGDIALLDLAAEIAAVEHTNVYQYSKFLGLPILRDIYMNPREIHVQNWKGKVLNSYFVEVSKQK